MYYDFAVVGGGAAGLVAAISAASLGDRVIIIESGNMIGKKILASGNGRCNMMNSGRSRYFGNTGFAEEVLKRFNAESLKTFWHSLGLITTEDSENRVYPCTFQASTVIQVLKTALKIYRVETELNSPVKECVLVKDGGFCISSGEKRFTAGRVLISSGGSAGRKTREEKYGYEILRRFGHTIHPLRPSLVPLTTDPVSVSGLSGIRTRCSVTLFDAHSNILHQEEGEMLFTDSGISGICVMQCARFVKEDGCYIEADLVKSIFPDDQSLLHELNCRKKQFGSLPPDMILIGMMNPKIAYAVMKQAGAAMKGEILSDLPDEFVHRVMHAIRHYRINITGTRGFDFAQVTAGGADCDEFKPDNMESRIVPGLHVAGELLDVDGDCGGFNLMFAFAGGILAGLSNRKKLSGGPVTIR